MGTTLIATSTNSGSFAGYLNTLVMEEDFLFQDPSAASTAKKRKKREVELTEDGKVNIVKEYAIGGDLPDQCEYGQ